MKFCEAPWKMSWGPIIAELVALFMLLPKWLWQWQTRYGLHTTASHLYAEMAVTVLLQMHDDFIQFVTLLVYKFDKEN